MSLFPPLDNRLPAPDDDENGPLLGAGPPPPAYGQAFPGDPDVERTLATNSSRSTNAPSADIQELARVDTSACELRIEDTSSRGRITKGAINRINYMAANSNGCFHANNGIFGRELMTFCCCGGGQGSGCADLAMLCLYIWFSVFTPAIAILGIVQIFFLLFEQGVAFEWAILLNNVMSLLSLAYIADLLRRNMQRFLRNVYNLQVPLGILPGSLNTFMSLTVTNINRIELLGIQQRNLLFAEMQDRDEATLHVMLYTDQYMNYVYRRPKMQLLVAITLLVVLTSAQIGGIVWKWDVFGSKPFSDLFTGSG